MIIYTSWVLSFVFGLIVGFTIKPLYKAVIIASIGGGLISVLFGYLNKLAT